MPRLHKNTWDCVVLPWWVDPDTELEIVTVNTLEYVIRDDYYKAYGTNPVDIYVQSSKRRALKKKGVDLTYRVISPKGRQGGTDVYACTEGDPLPLVEALLNKRYKMGWEIKEDKHKSKVFYDYGIQP